MLPRASVCFNVAFGREAASLQILATFGQQALHFLAAEEIRPALAHAGGNVVIEGHPSARQVADALLPRANMVRISRTPQLIS